MMWTIPWPSTPDEILLWSATVLVWTIVNYGLFDDPVRCVSFRERRRATTDRWLLFVAARSAVLAIVVAALPGFEPFQLLGRFFLAVGAFACSLALPIVRLRMGESARGRAWLAEWEIGANVGFLAMTAWIVAANGLAVVSPIVRLSVATTDLNTVVMSAAAVLFVVRGGTHIVRGLLGKSDTLPRLRPGEDADHPSQSSADERALWTPGIDVREFNRGRMIGNLERLLLVIFVVAGSYAAIGFLIAAKGLIRAKEFENREYAEYFVIGTLASTLVAVVVGIALKAFFACLGT